MLDLINRQKAEIERLQKAIAVIDVMEDQHRYSLRKAKAEAIKEFAERLKEGLYRTEFGTPVVDVADIDNLVKEMVGDDNGRR